MQKIQIDVSKKVNGAYEKVGTVDIYVPTLAEAGWAAEIETDKSGAPVIEDNLPVYKTQEANFVQAAILAAVKAMARNRLVSGTVQLKPGASIPADWDALCAEGERGGNGEALAAIRELKAAFGSWVASLGKSAGTQKYLAGMFASPVAISLQPEDRKAKILGYLGDFSQTLSAEALTKGQRYLQKLLDSCASGTADAEDF